MTSLFCSASTTASCTHFMAVSKSTISPLRTPREGAWPTPRIFSVPSGRVSPTTTQIFDVPISKPTIKSPLAMLLVLLEGLQKSALCRRLGRSRSGGLARSSSRRRRGRASRLRFRRGGCGRWLWRIVHRYRFHHSRRLFRINCVVYHFRGRLLECHWNVALHEQVHGRQFPVGVVRINQELLQSLQLDIEIIETKRDPAVIFVGHSETVAFRNIDLANLKTRLHEAAGAQTQQFERRLGFRRLDGFTSFERFARATQDQRQSQIFRQQFLLFHQNTA